MSIAGIGIDVASVERFERILERHGDRFVGRICRRSETDPSSSPIRAERLAGLFAAKEAVLKAFGTGWDQGLGFRQIEVVKESSGRPVVRLHGAAAGLARANGVSRVHVSITHDRGLAAAVAVLEREEGA